MLIGRVVGTLVATQKNANFAATKLLLVQPTTPMGEAVGTTLARHRLGAGRGRRSRAGGRRGEGRAGRAAARARPGGRREGTTWIYANPEALVNAAVTGMFKPTARWDYWSQPREKRLASEKDKPLYDGEKPMVS